MQRTIQRGMKVISQDQVIILKTNRFRQSDKRSVQHGPIVSLVQFESQKYELKDVDSTEELQFKGPVMPDTPDTDGNTEDADHHQWYEHQDPLK